MKSAQHAMSRTQAVVRFIQCLKPRKANQIWGCIKSSVTSKSREVIHLCPSQTSPGILHPVLGPPAQEIPGGVEVGPEEGHKNNQSEGIPLLQEQLRELGLFSWDKRRLQGELIAAFQ